MGSLITRRMSTPLPVTLEDQVFTLDIYHSLFVNGAPTEKFLASEFSYQKIPVNIAKGPRCRVCHSPKKTNPCEGGDQCDDICTEFGVCGYLPGHPEIKKEWDLVKKAYGKAQKIHKTNGDDIKSRDKACKSKTREENQQKKRAAKEKQAKQRQSIAYLMSTDEEREKMSDQFSTAMNVQLDETLSILSTERIKAARNQVIQSKKLKSTEVLKIKREQPQNDYSQPPKKKFMFEMALPDQAEAQTQLLHEMSELVKQLSQVNEKVVACRSMDEYAIVTMEREAIHSKISPVVSMIRDNAVKVLENELCESFSITSSDWQDIAKKYSFDDHEHE